MTDKPSPSERVTAQMTSELAAQSKRLITKLQTEFNGPDRKSVAKPVWHQIIRDNWDDPQWRMEQANRMGEVAFVHDALEAHGLPKNALHPDLPTAPTMPTMPSINPAAPIPMPTEPV